MQEKIPKIAHYIWIGGNEMPPLVKECVASFKQHLPDFEIWLWGDEECREVFEEYPYAKEAYDAGMYAFASDVVRLYFLYKYGGVYLDSDVEIFSSMNPFLKHSFFSGFQDPNHAVTAVMGSEKNGRFVGELLDYYKGRSFFDKKGNPDFTTNTKKINDSLLGKGIVLNGKTQSVNDDITIYSQEFFCPFHPKFGGKKTKKTVAVHHFNGSWVKYRRKLKEKLKKQRRIRRYIFSGLFFLGVTAFLFYSLYN